MSLSKVLLTILILVAAVVVAALCRSSLINLMLPSDSRPAAVRFDVQAVTAEEFLRISDELKAEFNRSFAHVSRFSDSGITSYEGPKTCLRCHETLEVRDAVSGHFKQVNLMDNLTGSAHYRFFTTVHPNVYGFNGELADDFPMGKINRPCPKPGSFAMTAWAEIVVLESGDTLSEGCGQCHIGGQYQAPLGEMLPYYRTTGDEKAAIDCLICHATAYDMGLKQVVVDENGRKRWGQDRSMRAALSATTPTAQACLRCHQHNFGGDIYIDAVDSSYMESLINTGRQRPRVKHPGSKRGTPYSPSWDVHAAAGVSCLGCHMTEGHYIARGTRTTTLMANDLPEVEVACEKCHTDAPHKDDPERADYLNEHTALVACQTCHIPFLHDDNVTMRDFGKTVFEDHPGIYVYDDTVKQAEPGSGIVYRWWNGDATFLGNPIGDNPNGADLYRFYTANHVWPEYDSYDYEGWYERVMRPIAKSGRPSKLYAMKKFNGRQHIDLANMGPFGGMFVPYNLPTYYTTGDPDRAASVEMDKSMMEMMYGLMFKYYMLDRFMSFMDIDGWNKDSFEDVKRMKNVEPRWIPNDAALEISHAIRRDGALTCGDCHSLAGVLDWAELGYTAEEVAVLTVNPLE
ncbi:MAG: hypothetical protein JSW34_07795 [Candidatus Zixiibacteriota bacterium]|nr:MAG: hypothetical protein JSW34_07795 [candidate division Zixibacteria bacterium]